MININKEIELSHRIQDGDEEAVNELVNANLRFVISVAKQYQNKGLPLVDLIQAGCIGCIEAAKKWDESRGFKFISYAVWWIRQSIMQAISLECRTIRIPMSQVACMNKINKVTEEFEQKHQRKPSADELEEELSISTDKIALNIQATNRMTSLSTPFKDEECGCLLDIIPNTDSEDSDQQLIESSTSQEIESIITNLPLREQDVLRMTFGLGVSSMTLEEIAVRFGIVPERARQLLKKALNTLKTKYGDELKELL
jgi:RNA polymerase primary sigma factor